MLFVVVTQKGSEGLTAEVVGERHLGRSCAQTGRM
jgi:hypothetical protein